MARSPENLLLININQKIELRLCNTITLLRTAISISFANYDVGYSLTDISGVVCHSLYMTNN